MRNLVYLAIIVMYWLFAVAPVIAGEAEDPENSKVKMTYDKGFTLTTEDNRFELKINGAVAFRYSYVDYDNTVSGNESDYSNFYMRRARLYFRGHAFDPRFSYFIHLQLEPHRTVNSHDLWLEYDLGEFFKIGAGRNKIAYGLEFLNSGLALNLVERSVMYGMSDLDVGGGGPQYPGGGTALFRMNWAAENGFATGGMTLYRSQGIQVRGQSASTDESNIEYQVGLWQGRGSSGWSNQNNDHLVAARFGYSPWGWIDWRLQGDGYEAERFKAGFFVSAYLNSSDLGGGYSEHGFNLSAITRYRGFSADFEVGTEVFDYDIYDEDFERFGWRVQTGYFVIPKTLEFVARYAEIERLNDPTYDRSNLSGLGVAEIHANGDFVTAIESRMSEINIGANYFINEWHRHKIQIDLSRLQRQFVADEEAGIERAPDQIDYMVRVGLQLVF